MTIVFEHPVTRDQYAQAWLDVPPGIRARCVDHLRATLDPSFFEDVRRRAAANPESWAVSGHLFGGMGLRNVLREAVRDDELPGVYYAWAETDEPIRNWDDYYVQAIEEAAGVPVPVETVRADAVAWGKTWTETIADVGPIRRLWNRLRYRIGF